MRVCSPPMRVRPRPHSTLCPARPLARRCVDLECMSEEERENKLEHQESEIEYLVHGQWNRSEIDANGRFGRVANAGRITLGLADPNEISVVSPS